MSVPELITATAPILTCEEARAWEKRRFDGNEKLEWAAMQQAGGALAQALLDDCGELGGFRERGRLLVLVGKGHNGGDALLAAAAILRRHPEATADLWFAFGPRALRPLTARAWREASTEFGGRVHAIQGQPGGGYDVALDGIFGFQFRPPIDAGLADAIGRVNAAAIRVRAAVDLPSADLFRADFTYATGAVKTPVLQGANAGRVRYLDLGFFTEDSAPAVAQRVLTAALLRPLAALRPAACDKRSYGHLLIVGGSRSYPGAVLMTTLAALQAGTGLVTAFVPESLVPAYAARAPEAMWVGWPETTAGGLALEGLSLLRERLGRATALVMGPGLARERETLALAREIMGMVELPVVLDADALQPEIVRAAKTPLVVTPHAGEFERIAAGADLAEFARTTGATIVLKGPVTRVASGSNPDKSRPRVPGIYHSLFGGPVLARGGSGDLLSGIVGALLAQDPAAPELAATRGVVWHGLAADLLARAHGQVAVNTTQLLDHLGPALRGV